MPINYQYNSFTKTVHTFLPVRTVNQNVCASKSRIKTCMCESTFQNFFHSFIVEPPSTFSQRSAEAYL